MDPPAPDKPVEPPDDDEARLIARRKLVKLGTYVVPAVLATLLISESTFAGSCSPNLGCQPRICAPAPCGPH